MKHSVQHAGGDVTIEACLHKNETLGARILKVDHAGEHAAVNIYRAQLLICRWAAPSLVAELREFQSHEERHRSIFAKQLQDRGARRCRSYALIGLGGFLLGFVTALCGRTAIAATTSAVERVVLRHLKQQLEFLKVADPSAFSAVASIVKDEQAHHDRAAIVSRQGRFWPLVIEPIVSLSTESVIWLGMRL